MASYVAEEDFLKETMNISTAIRHTPHNTQDQFPKVGDRVFVNILKYLHPEEVVSAAPVSKRWNNLTNDEHSPKILPLLRLDTWKAIFAATPIERTLPQRAIISFANPKSMAWQINGNELHCFDINNLQEERILNVQGSNVGSSDNQNRYVIAGTALYLIDVQEKRVIKEISLSTILQELPKIFDRPQRVIKAFFGETPDQPILLVTNGGYFFYWNPESNTTTVPICGLPTECRGELCEYVLKHKNLLFMAGYHFAAYVDVTTSISQHLLHSPAAAYKYYDLALDTASSSLYIQEISNPIEGYSNGVRFLHYHIGDASVTQTSQCELKNLLNPTSGLHEPIYATQKGMVFGFIKEKPLHPGAIYVSPPGENCIGIWNPQGSQFKYWEGDLRHVHEDLLIFSSKNEDKALHITTGQILPFIKGESLFFPKGKPEYVASGYHDPTIGHLTIYNKPAGFVPRPIAPTASSSQLNVSRVSLTPSLCTRVVTWIRTSRLVQLLQRIWDIFYRCCCCRR